MQEQQRQRRHHHPHPRSQPTTSHSTAHIQTHLIDIRFFLLPDPRVRLPEQRQKARSKHCPRIQGHERANKAYMTAVTHQLDQDAIEANSVFIQLYSHGDMAESSATRNSGLEVTALMANISGTTEQEMIQTAMSKASLSDVRYERGRCVAIQVGRPHDAMDWPRRCVGVHAHMSPLTTRVHDAQNFTTTAPQHAQSWRSDLVSPLWLDHTGGSRQDTHSALVPERRGCGWLDRTHLSHARHRCSTSHIYLLLVEHHDGEHLLCII